MSLSPKYLCLLSFILATALPAHASAELLDGKRTTFVLADSITQTGQIYASPAAEGAAQPMESVRPEVSRSAIVETIDVAPAWSVHLIGEPVLLTRDGFQYVGFYDHEARLTLAQRKLEDRDWSFHRFPVRMGWATGSHAKLSFAVDRDGYVHIAAYRRSLVEAPPAPHAIYYRSQGPHDIDAFDRLSLVSEAERPDYPTFFTGPDGRLYFTYRDGSSGKGNQIYNEYDPDTRTWQRLYDTPLFDGRNRMSAYGGPQLGPDGQWHALWVWRDTPNNASNHSLSYMRSTDLRHWETSSGEPVTLPVNSDTPGVIVEPAGPGGGLSNMTQVLGWDAQQQPVITYHKFDEDGHSQIFNARFADGAWHRVQATEWTYRWDYGGNGALPRKVTGGAVEPAEAGRLQQTVWNEQTRAQHILLDAATLEPIRREAPAALAAWRRGLLEPELDFQVPPDPNLLRAGGPMEVDLIDDAGEAAADGSRYVLRWEHAGRNRDRQVPKPWPEPTMLRVYRISAGEAP